MRRFLGAMRCLLLVAPVYALVTPRTAMRSAARRNTARPVRMSMDTSIFESVRPMLADALDAVADGTAAAQATADMAAVATVADVGWFDQFVKVIESSITALHGALGEGSYGVAIILFTLLLKTVTFPLNYAQIESTTKMQALQPAIKRIQAKYASDPQQMNLMMAELYSENELNPLAGCLPALVQIPIFIALYRALLNLAKEDLLEESFLWLPNLEGPVYGTQNADWLFKFDKWDGMVPPLGWHDTLAYLSMPVLLIIAQSISAKALQPPVDPKNEQAAQTNAILQYLPFLVGFFSLNVPSGLTIYWLVNNLFTTGSTLLIRQNVMAASPATMGGALIDTNAPKKKKSKDPSSFDDMMAASSAKQSKKAKTQDATTVLDQTTTTTTTPGENADGIIVDAEIVGGDEDLSKTAQKKLDKATKSRRKTRKN